MTEIKVEKQDTTYKTRPYVIRVDTWPYDSIQLHKHELTDLYRQITKLLVDDVVENFDPDKPRALNEDNPDKQIKRIKE
jgi:hypothetical protein